MLAMSELSITVIVPSFRRTDALHRCLEGIGNQIRSPDRVIVVVRDDDENSLTSLAAFRQDRSEVVAVAKPGQVEAMRQGLAAANTDIVAFTDDDAVPRADWVHRLLNHFSDETVGGVGGRDVIRDGSGNVAQGDGSRRVQVGRVSRWGRVTGNHHLGAGRPRDVDVLKGVNMAFRRSIVKLPRGLRGSGAEVHNDLALSLWVRRQGWRLVYDPELVVDHYVTERQLGHARGNRSPASVRDGAFNLTSSLLATDSVSAISVSLYSLTLGNGTYPGVCRTLVALKRGEGVGSVSAAMAAMHGHLSALKEYGRGKEFLRFE